MPAECWAHVVGVASVVTNGPSAPNPLGACFECGVFGCSEHAERDAGKGKWICFQTVAEAIAASAGLGTPVEGLELDTSAEFERRFPVLAGATQGFRQAAQRSFEAHPPVSGASAADLSLLGDAVGVAQALMGVQVEGAVGRGERVLAWEPAGTEVGPHELFATPLADLLGDLRA
jgi:hypothetical protein